MAAAAGDVADAVVETKKDEIFGEYSSLKGVPSRQLLRFVDFDLGLWC